MNTIAKIAYPCRAAVPGPEYNEALLPLRPFAFKEEDSLVALVYVADPQHFCKWLAQKCDADGKFFMFGEFLTQQSKGKWVVDADGMPLCQVGCLRVAHVIRDLLNKYKPELSR